MMLRCIIVDDEPLSRAVLSRFCEKSGMADVVGSFDNAVSAIEYLKTNKVELVFLDVEMPQINGFQMLEYMPYRPQVVMITSKTDYAFTAFEYNVTDFLKKPVDYNRFLTAFNKVKELAEKTAAPAETDETEIVIKCDGAYVRLQQDDVLYIEGMGDYVNYVTNEKKYITLNTMKAVEEKLNSSVFLRVHRSYIINISKVKTYAGNNVLIAGASIPVSKPNKASLLQKLGF
ncbi:MAG: LytTR family DNA-binding domain-containing protein [Chitinophagaceae bacterium]|nr:LytTR family DNA-binding domain-containing protein [Chitinophagaceae bacterium]